MDVFDFLATQRFLALVPAAAQPALFAELRLACLLKDASCSFLTSTHQLISLTHPSSSHDHPQPLQPSNLDSEFALEIYISECASSTSQALFFQIYDQLFFVIHTFMGNIHLSKTNAIDRGLLFEWPYVQMKIVPNRSPNASIVSPDSNVLAFRSLSSVLDRMEHKLTVDLLRHPVIENSLHLNSAKNTPLSEHLNLLIDFTRQCQHALDTSLSTDALRSLVLTGEYAPTSIAITPGEPSLFANISSAYLSTFLSEESVNWNRDKSSSLLLELSSQLREALDGILSARHPDMDGYKVTPLSDRLCAISEINPLGNVFKAGGRDLRSYRPCTRRACRGTCDDSAKYIANQ